MEKKDTLWSDFRAPGFDSKVNHHYGWQSVEGDKPTKYSSLDKFTIYIYIYIQK